MRAVKFLACFFILSCTELEVNEDLPSLNGLTSSNINTGLPVININVSPDSFDLMYRNYAKEISVTAQMNLYDKGVKQMENKAAYIDIRGRSSARADLKSLGVVLAEPFNSQSYEIFNGIDLLEGDDLSTLYALRLRNSGNDFGKTMLKDLAYTRLAVSADLNVELRYGTPVQVFVNETYYGLMNIRSEDGRLGLSGLLGVDSSRITLIKMDGDNGNLEYREGSSAQVQRFREAIKNEDMEVIKEMVDLENFMDYVIFEDYIGNTDWPQNNVSAYSIDEGPFRFILFDLDFAAFRTKNAILPEMEFREDDLSKVYQILFEQDEEFSSKLEERQKELYQLFSPARFNTTLEEMASDIEEEIPYLIAKYQQPASILYWKIELETLKRDFERRDFYIRRKYNIN